MELTPKAIREVEFREKLRGYHPDDVDAFVEQVAAAVEALQRRLDDLGGGSSGQGPVSDDTIRRTLVLAQRTADMVLAEAQESANKTVADAEAEAAAVVREARADADRVAQEERGRLEGDLERLSAIRSQLEGDVNGLRDYADRLRERLRHTLLEQLGVLDANTETDSPPVLSDVGELGVQPQPPGEDPEAGGRDPGAGLSPAGGDGPGGAVAEADADIDLDMIARARHIASLVPGQGEEDPFLAELRRAVDEPGPTGEGAGARTDAELSIGHPALAMPPDFDELRGIPEGGRLSGRLFRRR